MLPTNPEPSRLGVPIDKERKSGAFLLVSPPRRGLGGLILTTLSICFVSKRSIHRLAEVPLLLFILNFFTTSRQRCIVGLQRFNRNRPPFQGVASARRSGRAGNKSKE